MKETTRVQTAFRFSPDLLDRLKRNAKREKKSLNRYVEDIMERETRLEWPRLPQDYPVSEEILSLRCTGHWVEPSREELEADPRMAHVLGHAR